jgi:hypothetical protein
MSEQELREFNVDVEGDSKEPIVNQTEISRDKSENIAHVSLVNSVD